MTKLSILIMFYETKNDLVKQNVCTELADFSLKKNRNMKIFFFYPKTGDWCSSNTKRTKCVYKIMMEFINTHIFVLLHGFQLSSNPPDDEILIAE